MKKWSLLLLVALLLMPLSAKAEELPEVLGAVMQGFGEGLQEGALAVSASAQDLTLSLRAADTRIEEGRTLLLTIEAGNPYPKQTDVTLTITLPDRLSCAQPLTWNATLKAAQVDAKTGETIPSCATFTREVTLLPGGESEEIDVQCEMAMGTRFYRSALPLKLCVPHITACASIEDTDDVLVEAGESFTYLVEIANDGAAPKDVPVSLLLPGGVKPDGAMPAGFALKGGQITGAVRAESMAGSAIRLKMRVQDDALEGDADACRLLRGVLKVDGKNIDLPMLKAVAPMISARLTPLDNSLKEGEVTELIITVANSGLAPADVDIACMLPKGLTVLHDLSKSAAEADSPAGKPDSGDDSDKTKEDEPDSLPPVLSGDNGGVPPSGSEAQAVMNPALPEAAWREESGQLLLSMHMDAARETDGGTATATKEIALSVRADSALDSVDDRLLGAALAWRTDSGESKLGEPIALRIDGSGLLGLSSSEWNGILLAALLMLVTVCCLYSAVKSDRQQNDYCFE